MKTRGQLARGYVDGTLNEYERKVAEANPVVMSMVRDAQQDTNTTESKHTSKKKGAANA